MTHRGNIDTIPPGEPGGDARHPPGTHMTAEAEVVRLPCNAAARRERQMRAAWAEEDRLTAALKAAQVKARQLEREVSRDRGYLTPLRREALARPERGR